MKGSKNTVNERTGILHGIKIPMSLKSSGTKRAMAIFLALLMVVSAFVIMGNNDVADAPGDTIVPEQYITYHYSIADNAPTYTFGYYGIASTEYNPEIWKSTENPVLWTWDSGENTWVKSNAQLSNWVGPSTGDISLESAITSAIVQFDDMYFEYEADGDKVFHYYDEDGELQSRPVSNGATLFELTVTGLDATYGINGSGSSTYSVKYMWEGSTKFQVDYSIANSVITATYTERSGDEGIVIEKANGMTPLNFTYKQSSFASVSSVSTNKVFGGWTTGFNGSVPKDMIYPGDVVSDGVKDLYAIWVEPDVFPQTSYSVTSVTSDMPKLSSSGIKFCNYKDITSISSYDSNGGFYYNGTNYVAYGPNDNDHSSQYSRDRMFTSIYHIIGKVTTSGVELLSGTYRGVGDYKSTLQINGKVDCMGNVIIDSTFMDQTAFDSSNRKDEKDSGAINANYNRLIIGTGIDVKNSYTGNNQYVFLHAPYLLGGATSNSQKFIEEEKTIVSNSNSELNGLTVPIATYIIVHSGIYSHLNAGSINGVTIGSQNHPLSTYMVIKKATAMGVVSGTSGSSTVNGTGVVIDPKNRATGSVEDSSYTQGGTFVYAYGLDSSGDTYEDKATGHAVPTYYNGYGVARGEWKIDENCTVEGGPYGGTNAQGIVRGSTHVFVTGVSSLFDVQGGGRNYTSHCDNTYVEITGRAVIRHVACGTITDGGTSESDVVDWARILVDGKARIATLLGAGYDTWTISSNPTMKGGYIKIQINGGEIGYVYGGGMRGSIGKNDNDSNKVNIFITMTGGTIKYDLFGGGKGALDKTHHSVDQMGYMGRWENTANMGNSDTTGYSRVVGDIEIKVAGGIIEGSLYGGGESTPTVDKYFGKDFDYYDPKNSTKTFKGSNENVAEVIGNIFIEVSGSASVSNVFGAGKGVKSDADGNVIIDNYVNVYHKGGANIIPTQIEQIPYYSAILIYGDNDYRFIPWVLPKDKIGTNGVTNEITYKPFVSSGESQYDYYARLTGDSTLVMKNDGDKTPSVNESVYGGGAFSKVKGNTIVKLDSTTVGHDVFGGGLGIVGKVSVEGTRTVWIAGNTQITGSVYGGSQNGTDGIVMTITDSNRDAADVVNKLNRNRSIVVVEKGTISGSVFGGGLMGETYGNTEVYIGYHLPSLDAKTPVLNNYTGLTGVQISMDSVFAGGNVSTGGSDTDVQNAYTEKLVQGNGIVKVYGSTNNMISISGSIMGSGNACLTAGTTEIDLSNFYNASEMTGIHRADVVVIDKTSINVKGRSPITKVFDQDKIVSLYKIGELIVKNGSTITVDNPMDDIGGMSSYINDKTPTTETTPLNRLVFSSGSTAYIRSEGNNGLSYNEVKGYFLLSTNQAGYGAYVIGKESNNGGFSVTADGSVKGADTSITDGVCIWYIAGISKKVLTLDLTASEKIDEIVSTSSYFTISKFQSDTDIVYTGGIFTKMSNDPDGNPYTFVRPGSESIFENRSQLGLALGYKERAEDSSVVTLYDPTYRQMAIDGGDQTYVQGTFFKKDGKESDINGEERNRSLISVPMEYEGSSSRTSGEFRIYLTLSGMPIDGTSYVGYLTLNFQEVKLISYGAVDPTTGSIIDTPRSLVASTIELRVDIYVYGSSADKEENNAFSVEIKTADQDGLRSGESSTLIPQLYSMAELELVNIGYVGSGSGVMPSITVTDRSYYLPDCKFIAPEGKSFDHWLLKNSAGEKIDNVSPGDIMAVDSDEQKVSVKGSEISTVGLTVTPVWTDKLQVVFDPNGGHVTSAYSILYTENGVLYELPDTNGRITAPDGEVFGHWSVTVGNKNAVTKYPGDTVKMTGDTVIKAIWVDPVSITFKPGVNGQGSDYIWNGVGEAERFELPEPSDVNISAADDYHFLRWSVKIVGRDAVDKYPGDLMRVNDTTEITAVWSNGTTYTVTFDANGGGGSKASETVAAGANYKLPDSTGLTAPTGQHLLGWSVFIGGGFESEYDVGDYITVSNNATVKAIWSNEVSVEFFKADGETKIISMSDKEAYGARYVIPEPSNYTESGKTFLYWYWVLKDEKYYAGQVITVKGNVDNSTLSLVAVFEDNSNLEHRIVFEPVNGSGYMAIQKTNSAKFKLLNCDYTSSDPRKAFLKWEVRIGEEFAGYYYPGDLLPNEGRINADVFIIPVWAGDVKTISFQKGEGEGSMKSIKVAYGSKYFLTGSYFTAPEGQSFSGWEEGGVIIYPGYPIEITKDHTYTATFATGSEILFSSGIQKTGTVTITAMSNQDNTTGWSSIGDTVKWDLSKNDFVTGSSGYVGTLLGNIVGNIGFSVDNLYFTDSNGDFFFPTLDLEFKRTLNDGTVQTAHTYLTFSDVQYYSIYFVDHGFTTERKYIENTRLDKENCEKASGTNFNGWYLDSKYVNRYDYNAIVNDESDGMYLYARYTYVVTLDNMNGTSFQLHVSQEDNGALLSKADLPEPTREGYDFKGWCKDKDLVYDWAYQSDRVTEDMTLYARWSGKEVRVYFWYYDEDNYMRLFEAGEYEVIFLTTSDEYVAPNPVNKDAGEAIDISSLGNLPGGYNWYTVKLTNSSFAYQALSGTTYTVTADDVFKSGSDKIYLIAKNDAAPTTLVFSETKFGTVPMVVTNNTPDEQKTISSLDDVSNANFKGWKLLTGSNKGTISSTYTYGASSSSDAENGIILIKAIWEETAYDFSKAYQLNDSRDIYPSVRWGGSFDLIDPYHTVDGKQVNILEYAEKIIDFGDSSFVKWTVNSPTNSTKHVGIYSDTVVGTKVMVYVTDDMLEGYDGDIWEYYKHTDTVHKRLEWVGDNKPQTMEIHLMAETTKIALKVKMDLKDEDQQFKSTVTIEDPQEFLVYPNGPDTSYYEMEGGKKVYFDEYGNKYYEGELFGGEVLYYVNEDGSARYYYNHYDNCWSCIHVSELDKIKINPDDFVNDDFIVLVDKDCTALSGYTVITIASDGTVDKKTGKSIGDTISGSWLVWGFGTGTNYTIKASDAMEGFIVLVHKDYNKNLSGYTVIKIDSSGNVTEETGKKAGDVISGNWKLWGTGDSGDYKVNKTDAKYRNSYYSTKSKGWRNIVIDQYGLMKDYMVSKTNEYYLKAYVWYDVYTGGEYVPKKFLAEWDKDGILIYVCMDDNYQSKGEKYSLGYRAGAKLGTDEAREAGFEYVPLKGFYLIDSRGDRYEVDSWATSSKNEKISTYTIIPIDIKDSYEFKYQLNDAVRSGYTLIGWHNDYVSIDNALNPSADLERTVIVMIDRKDGTVKSAELITQDAKGFELRIPLLVGDYVVDAKDADADGVIKIVKDNTPIPSSFTVKADNVTKGTNFEVGQSVALDSPSAGKYWKVKDRAIDINQYTVSSYYADVNGYIVIKSGSEATQHQSFTVTVISKDDTETTTTKGVSESVTLADLTGTGYVWMVKSTRLDQDATSYVVQRAHSDVEGNILVRAVPINSEPITTFTVITVVGDQRTTVGYFTEGQVAELGSPGEGMKWLIGDSDQVGYTVDSADADAVGVIQISQKDIQISSYQVKTKNSKTSNPTVLGTYLVGSQIKLDDLEDVGDNKFIGWKVKSGLINEVYVVDTKDSTKDNNDTYILIEAVWTNDVGADSKYTVMLISDYGSISSDKDRQSDKTPPSTDPEQEITSDNEATLPTITGVDGYSHVGWRIITGTNKWTVNGSTYVVDEDDADTSTKDIVLEAVWKRIFTVQVPGQPDKTYKEEESVDLDYTSVERYRVYDDVIVQGGKLDDPDNTLTLTYRANWQVIEYKVNLTQPSNGHVDLFLEDRDGNGGISYLNDSQVSGMDFYFGDKIQLSYTPNNSKVQFIKWVITGEYYISDVSDPNATIIIQGDCSISVDESNGTIVDIKIAFNNGGEERDGNLNAADLYFTRVFLRDKTDGEMFEAKYDENGPDDAERYTVKVPYSTYETVIQYGWSLPMANGDSVKLQSYEDGPDEYVLVGDINITINGEVEYVYDVITAGFVDKISDNVEKYVDSRYGDYVRDGNVPAEIYDYMFDESGNMLHKSSDLSVYHYSQRADEALDMPRDDENAYTRILDSEGNVIAKITRYVGTLRTMIADLEERGLAINNPAGGTPPVTITFSQNQTYSTYEGFPWYSTGSAQVKDVFAINTENNIAVMADSNMKTTKTFYLNWVRTDSPADVIIQLSPTPEPDKYVLVDVKVEKDSDPKWDIPGQWKVWGIGDATHDHYTVDGQDAYVKTVASDTNRFIVLIDKDYTLSTYNAITVTNSQVNVISATDISSINTSISSGSWKLWGLGDPTSSVTAGDFATKYGNIIVLVSADYSTRLLGYTVVKISDSSKTITTDMLEGYTTVSEGIRYAVSDSRSVGGDYPIEVYEGYDPEPKVTVGTPLGPGESVSYSPEDGLSIKLDSNRSDIKQGAASHFTITIYHNRSDAYYTLNDVSFSHPKIGYESDTELIGYRSWGETVTLPSTFMSIQTGKDAGDKILGNWKIWGTSGPTSGYYLIDSEDLKQNFVILVDKDTSFAEDTITIVWMTKEKSWYETGYTSDSKVEAGWKVWGTSTVTAADSPLSSYGPKNGFLILTEDIYEYMGLDDYTVVELGVKIAHWKALTPGSEGSYVEDKGSEFVYTMTKSDAINTGDFVYTLTDANGENDPKGENNAPIFQKKLVQGGNVKYYVVIDGSEISIYDKNDTQKSNKLNIVMYKNRTCTEKWAVGDTETIVYLDNRILFVPLVTTETVDVVFITNYMSFDNGSQRMSFTVTKGGMLSDYSGVVEGTEYIVSFINKYTGDESLEYVFKGFYTSDGIRFDPTDNTFVLDSNMTFIAKWDVNEKKKKTFSYEQEGSNADISAMQDAVMNSSISEGVPTSLKKGTEITISINPASGYTVDVDRTKAELGKTQVSKEIYLDVQMADAIVRDQTHPFQSWKLWDTGLAISPGTKLTEREDDLKDIFLVYVAQWADSTTGTYNVVYVKDSTMTANLKHYEVPSITLESGSWLLWGSGSPITGGESYTIKDSNVIDGYVVFVDSTSMSRLNGTNIVVFATEYGDAPAAYSLDQYYMDKYGSKYHKIEPDYVYRYETDHWVMYTYTKLTGKDGNFIKQYTDGNGGVYKVTRDETYYYGTAVTYTLTANTEESTSSVVYKGLYPYVVAGGSPSKTYYVSNDGSIYLYEDEKLTLASINFFPTKHLLPKEKCVVADDYKKVLGNLESASLYSVEVSQVSTFVEFYWLGDIAYEIKSDSTMTYEDGTTPFSPSGILFTDSTRTTPYTPSYSADILKTIYSKSLSTSVQGDTYMVKDHHLYVLQQYAASYVCFETANNYYDGSVTSSGKYKDIFGTVWVKDANGEFWVETLTVYTFDPQRNTEVPVEIQFYTSGEHIGEIKSGAYPAQYYMKDQYGNHIVGNYLENHKVTTLYFEKSDGTVETLTVKYIQENEYVKALDNTSNGSGTDYYIKKNGQVVVNDENKTLADGKLYHHYGGFIILSKDVVLPVGEDTYSVILIGSSDTKYVATSSAVTLPVDTKWKVWGTGADIEESYTPLSSHAKGKFIVLVEDGTVVEGFTVVTLTYENSAVDVSYRNYAFGQTVNTFTGVYTIQKGTAPAGATQSGYYVVSESDVICHTKPCDEYISDYSISMINAKYNVRTEYISNGNTYYRDAFGNIFVDWLGTPTQLPGNRGFTWTFFLEDSIDLTIYTKKISYTINFIINGTKVSTTDINKVSTISSLGYVVASDEYYGKDIPQYAIVAFDGPEDKRDMVWYTDPSYTHEYDVHNGGYLLKPDEFMADVVMPSAVTNGNNQSGSWKLWGTDGTDSNYSIKSADVHEGFVLLINSAYTDNVIKNYSIVKIASNGALSFETNTIEGYYISGEWKVWNKTESLGYTVKKSDAYNGFIVLVDMGYTVPEGYAVIEIGNSSLLMETGKATGYSVTGSWKVWGGNEYQNGSQVILNIPNQWKGNENNYFYIFEANWSQTHSETYKIVFASNYGTIAVRENGGNIVYTNSLNNITLVEPTDVIGLKFKGWKIWNAGNDLTESHTFQDTDAIDGYILLVADWGEDLTYANNVVYATEFGVAPNMESIRKYQFLANENISLYGHFGTYVIYLHDYYDNEDKIIKYELTADENRCITIPADHYDLEGYIFVGWATLYENPLNPDDPDNGKRMYTYVPQESIRISGRLVTETMDLYPYYIGDGSLIKYYDGKQSDLKVDVDDYLAQKQKIPAAAVLDVEYYDKEKDIWTHDRPLSASGIHAGYYEVKYNATIYTPLHIPEEEVNDDYGNTVVNYIIKEEIASLTIYQVDAYVIAPSQYVREGDGTIDVSQNPDEYITTVGLVPEDYTVSLSETDGYGTSRSEPGVTPTHAVINWNGFIALFNTAFSMTGDYVVIKIDGNTQSPTVTAQNVTSSNVDITGGYKLWGSQTLEGNTYKPRDIDAALIDGHKFIILVKDTVRVSGYTVVTIDDEDVSGKVYIGKADGDHISGLSTSYKIWGETALTGSTYTVNPEEDAEGYMWDMKDGKHYYELDYNLRYIDGALVIYSEDTAKHEYVGYS